MPLLTLYTHGVNASPVSIKPTQLWDLHNHHDVIPVKLNVCTRFILAIQVAPCAWNDAIVAIASRVRCLSAFASYDH